MKIFKTFNIQHPTSNRSGQAPCTITRIAKRKESMFVAIKNFIFRKFDLFFKFWLRGNNPRLVRGQVIIESIVAISIALTGLLGVFTLLNKSLGSNVFVADQYTATNLAAEGIELVKNLIDKNIKSGIGSWNAGINNGNWKIDYNDLDLAAYNVGEKLRIDKASGIYSYDSGVDSKYERKITISQNPPASPREIIVMSEVFWIGQGGAQFNVQLEDHFFNWR